MLESVSVVNISCVRKCEVNYNATYFTTVKSTGSQEGTRHPIVLYSLQLFEVIAYQQISAGANGINGISCITETLASITLEPPLTSEVTPGINGTEGLINDASALLESVLNISTCIFNPILIDLEERAAKVILSGDSMFAGL